MFLVINNYTLYKPIHYAHKQHTLRGFNEFEYGTLFTTEYNKNIINKQ